MVQVFGYHRITDIGDGRSASVGELDNILIDKQVCSILDIIQDTLSPWNPQAINCTAYKFLDVGEYMLEETVVYGNAKYMSTAVRTSHFTAKNYTIRIAAQVDNSPAAAIPKNGFKNGHQIMLPGTGFAEGDVSKYTCKASGYPCTVKESTKDYIKI
jgi:hypothetical protein